MDEISDNKKMWTGVRIRFLMLYRFLLLFYSFVLVHGGAEPELIVIRIYLARELNSKPKALAS